MQNIQIPTCFFPTTVLFVDDNRDFLLNFVLQLDENIAFRTLDNPNKALEIIHKWYPDQNGIYQQNFSHIGSNDQKLMNGALANAQIYNPNRFAEVSVVVVDYAMPEMDGLEFCRKIENPHIKKILLTGQADEKLAVDAFNEGLIHRYIKKSDELASEKITQGIFDLQQEYFQNISTQISRDLFIAEPAPLKEPLFQTCFYELVKENEIVEYYLAGNTGSFFLLDGDANISFLIVKNEKEMSEYQQLALSEDAGETVVQTLRHREKIPACFSSDMISLERGDWSSCLLPASKLAAGETYYYAYQKGNSLHNIRQHKILSYNRYLEELDGEELLSE